MPTGTVVITPEESQVISSPSVPSANFAMAMALLAIAVALPVEVTIPVRLALVVTFPAVNPEAVPERFVAVPDEGVPNAPPE